MGNRGRRLTEREKRWIVGLGLGLFLVLFVLVAWYAGRPLVAFASEPERFQQWVDSQGLLAPVLFMGMVILQVVVAVIPGEPLEIAAGYAFGALEGTVLCVLGTLIGGVLVFLLVRRFGAQAVEVFFDLEKFRSLRFFQDRRRLTFWVFLVFFLPGTPKDVLCYFVGLTDMRLRTWILVSAVARIPSIITSTVGGNALGGQDYRLAVIVFAVTLGVSLLGGGLYTLYTRRNKKKN